MMDVDITMLAPHNASILGRVAPGVFDHPVDPRWSGEFLRDPRHHLAIAVSEGVIVGFASGVHYVHPDKGPELWINEVGVAPIVRGRGIGGRLVARLCDHGRELGCREAWVLTDYTNRAAIHMYAKAGGLEHPSPSTMFTFKLAADT
jgi:GNAT superfamily N-acetyltransferase